MNYKIITDPKIINRDSWSKYLTDHPNGNFFQSPKAYDYFISVKNYQPIAIFALSGAEIIGVLMGVIIKENKGIRGYISRRCIVSGGPLLLGDNTEEVAGIMLDEMNKKLEKRVTYIEFRNFYNLELFKNIFCVRGYDYEEYLNFVLKVTSLEVNMKLLERTRRQQIAKGIKLGAEIIEPTDIGQVKEFYSLLRKFYKNKVKKPLPPFSLFEEFYFHKELGKYFLIRFNNKIVNGVMAPIYKDTIYDWYGNMSTEEHKEIYSGVLSTWASIEYAAKNELKFVDFLGAGKPNDVYGVREFKAKFGGDLVNYGRFIKINNKALYNLGKFGLKVLGKLNK